MQPKVLILIDTYFVGGAGKVLLQFLKNSDPSRFDYVLGTFRYPHPPSTEFIDTARAMGLEPMLFSQRFPLDPGPLWEVFRALRAGRFNLIETHGYKGHLLAWVMKRLLPVKWVGMTHGWTDENRKMRLYNRLERWLLARADQVICVSPQLEAVMRERRPQEARTALVLNGIDPAMIRGENQAAQIRNRIQKTDRTLVVGAFGRMSPEKGQDVLLRACAGLLERLDALLLLVGDGPQRPLLEQLAAELGLPDRVVFEGQQANMRDYYEAIDLLVLPSRSEGLPFVLLEAMALGRPVLATDVGAVGRVINHGRNGWLVPAGDVPALAAQLATVLSDRDQLAAMGREAKETLFPRFSATRQAAEVAAIYQALVNGR